MISTGAEPHHLRFRDLAAERGSELLAPPELRPPRETIVALHEISLWRALLPLAGTWALIGAAFAAALWTRHWAVWIAAALVIGRSQHALAVVMHDAAHRRFVHPDSDFLTLLAIWDAFHDEVEKLSQGRLRKFCRQHFLNYNRMREWRDIHAQLAEALGDLEPRRDAPARTPPTAEPEEQDMRFGGERYRVLKAEITRPAGLAAYDAGFTIDDQLTIACGSGAIRPTLIQRAGKPVMETQALLRGRAVPAGTNLG